MFAHGEVLFDEVGLLVGHEGVVSVHVVDGAFLDLEVVGLFFFVFGEVGEEVVGGLYLRLVLEVVELLGEGGVGVGLYLRSGEMGEEVVLVLLDLLGELLRLVVELFLLVLIGVGVGVGLHLVCLDGVLRLFLVIDDWLFDLFLLKVLLMMIVVGLGLV